MLSHMNKHFEVTADKTANGLRGIIEFATHAKQIFTGVMAVPNGGNLLGGYVASALNLPLVPYNPDCQYESILIIDDVYDTGRTLAPFIENNLYVAVLFTKTPIVNIKRQHNDRFYAAFAAPSDQWLDFFWESKESNGIQDNVRRILTFLGEDVRRDGLIDTPKRVERSYESLFAGYKADIPSLFRVFDVPRDEMVILKDIEFYSTCEHHMLPFFGKAHIAYIPQSGRVIGVSKLARLLEAHARRLQVQERICQDVVRDIDEYLRPLGAACVLEAQHMCMTSRGVQKQNSVMITSALSGAFKTNDSTRQEFMAMIK